MGGECRTIACTINEQELQGRLLVLSKVAYLFNQCTSWDRARSVYFAIVGSIEEGEADWGSSFGHYDLMCLAPVYDSKTEQKLDRGSQLGKNRYKKGIIFAEFQKGECTLNPPHKAWLRNNYEMVEHFCTVCYHAKLGKLDHCSGSDSINP